MTGNIVLEIPAMIKAARACADNKVLLDQHIARIDALADAARAAECSEAASIIARAKEPLRQAAGQVATYAVLITERTRWARIAAGDPSVRRYLELLDTWGDSYGAYLASAQSAEALQVFMSRTSTSMFTLAMNTEGLNKVMQARLGTKYARTASVIDEIFALPLSASIRAQAIAAGGFTDYWVKAKGFEEHFRQFTGTSRVGMAGRVGGHALGPLVDVILQAWSDGDNPYLSAERRRERLAAAGAGGIGIAILAALAAGAACGAVSAGTLAVACGAAVGTSVSVTGGFVLKAAIEHELPEDETVSWKEYKRRAKEAREKAVKELTSQYYRGNLDEPKYRPIMQGYDGVDDVDLDALDRELRKEAREYALKEVGYPPKDPLDAYYQEEFDRQQWRLRNEEVEENR